MVWNVLSRRASVVGVGSLVGLWHSERYSSCEDPPPFNIGFSYLMFQLQSGISTQLRQVDRSCSVKDALLRDSETCTKMVAGEVISQASVCAKVERCTENISCFSRIAKNLVEESAYECSVDVSVEPTSPLTPSLVLKFSYSEAVDRNTGMKLWSFGGDAHLLASYIYRDDIVEFHTSLKDACDKHGAELYPVFKQHADGISKASNGLGGVYFENFASRPSNSDSSLNDQQAVEALIVNCVQEIIPCYIEILKRHRNDDIHAQNIKWREKCDSTSSLFELESFLKAHNYPEDGMETKTLGILKDPPRNWAVDTGNLREMSFEVIMAQLMARTQKDLSQKQ